MPSHAFTSVERPGHRYCKSRAVPPSTLRHQLPHANANIAVDGATTMTGVRALGNEGRSKERQGVGMNKLIGIVLLLVTLAATSILVDRSGTGVTMDVRQINRLGNDTKMTNAVDDGAAGADGTAEGGYNDDDSSNTSSSSSNAQAWRGHKKQTKKMVRIKFEKKYASLRIADRGKVDCQIHTSPVSVTPLPNVKGKPSPSLWLNYSSKDDGNGNEKDGPKALPPDDDQQQYMIHIHGMMHTGTGYLRHKIYDALVNTTFFIEQSSSNGRPVVASVQNANWPCRHLVTQGKGKKACNVPQDEGQHLQSVYPSLKFQQQALKERKKQSSGMSPADERMFLSQVGHLSSLCAFTNGSEEDKGDDKAANATASEEEDTDDKAAKRIGNILFQQWLPFWEDPSATFLLQKTPTLEALFHERVKVLPTFHVIIVRHPWTSPSWSGNYAYPKNKLDYNIMWAKPYEHILETLRQGKIEWYAVITYEALVMYGDIVVDELMEIVKSGMRRYGNDRTANVGRRRLLDSSSSGSSSRQEKDLSLEGQTKRMHRRLPIHSTDIDPTTYLIPKEASMKLWRECVQNKQCSKELERLTKKVFPFFGFVSVSQADEESGGPPSMSPLSSSPGIVGVSQEFGRVLYTSEAEAFKFRTDSREEEGSMEKGDREEEHAIDYTPSQELISNLNAIFT